MMPNYFYTYKDIRAKSGNVSVNIKLAKYTRKIANLKTKLAEKVMEDTMPYVPYRTGKMTNASYITAGNNIVYKAPYARYVWIGISRSGKPMNYTHTFHPLACARWFEVSKKANMAKWKAYVESLMEE